MKKRLMAALMTALVLCTAVLPAAGDPVIIYAPIRSRSPEPAAPTPAPPTATPIPAPPAAKATTPVPPAVKAMTPAAATPTPAPRQNGGPARLYGAVTGCTEHDYDYTIVHYSGDAGFYCKLSEATQAYTGGYFLGYGKRYDPDSRGNISLRFSKPGLYVLELRTSVKPELDSLWIRIEDPDSELMKKVRSVAAECRAQGLTDDWDIALWLHDWLTGHAHYDYTFTEHGPEGVLLKGYGVCESYSKAYELLLNEFGIPNYYQYGHSKGEEHSWNAVRLDGEWCWVDVTWDDPGTDTKPVSGNEWHHYFGLPDSMLKEDHEYKAIYPCNTLDIHYYMRKGFPEAYYHYVYNGFDGSGGLTGQAARGLNKVSVDVSSGYCIEVRQDGGTTYMNDHPYIIFPIMAVLLSKTPITGPNGGKVYYTFDYDAGAKTLNGVRRTGP